MNKPVKNLSASVHQKLLNRSHETNQPFNELIQYFGIERLLYRLSLSQYSRQFILKGALMFNVWGMANFRPTHDVDLLGHVINTLEHIKSLFENVCRLEVEPDGLEFDKNVSVERIIVTVFLSGSDFCCEGFLVGDPAICSLTTEDAQLNFSHVQPRAMFWRVMPFKSLSPLKSDAWRKEKKFQAHIIHPSCFCWECGVVWQPPHIH